MTVAQITTALNAGTYTGITTAFDTNDYVYLRSDLVGGSGQKDFEYKPYKVVYVMDFVTNTNGDALDANGEIADGSAAADVATDGTTPDTSAQWPTFYVLELAIGPNAGRRIRRHETEIVSVTGANVLRDANDWTNPA